MLCCLLLQLPHASFERVGNDIWHRCPDPIPAVEVLFGIRVPFLDLKRNWLGPIKGGPPYNVMYNIVYNIVYNWLGPIKGAMPT